MRLTVFLLIVFTLKSTASVFGQKITIQAEREPLVNVLNAVRQQSGYAFLFNAAYLEQARPVSLDIRDKDILEALPLIFEGQPFEYEIHGKIITVMLEGPGENARLSSLAAQATISGLVTDTTGTPLPGVSVQLKGTQRGATTGADGRYELTNTPSDATLVFTLLGFQTAEVAVDNRGELNIQLKHDVAALSEVVVVGYGTQRKSDVTGSVASFDTKFIESTPSTNIGQVLQGKIAGLSISENAGSAEGNLSIQIRGVNSITASNSPLIILDGIPYSGGISGINPNDISSIEILKDASAAAIYGARASNGVILITTKKGADGKPAISYTGSYAIDQMTNLPDMMDGKTFYEKKVELRGEDAITPSEEEMYEMGKDTDWLDLATRLGQRQDHTLSISGGSNRMNYYISGSLNDTKGIAIGDDFKRFTIKLNFDTKVTDWLTIGTNTLFGYYDRGGSPADMEFAFKQNPLNKAYNEDGSLTIYPWPEDLYWRNPLEPTTYMEENIERSINSNNYAEISLPLKGLKYKLNTGYSYRGSSFEQYIDRHTQSGYEKGGRARVQNAGTEEWVIENIVNYNKEFGKSVLFLTGLYSAQETEYKNHSLAGENFPNDVRTYYQLRATSVLSPTDSYSKTSIISQMIRANYSYDNRYLLTLTARRDGYSGFGEETKFGTFPSVALGWNIHNEEFMQNSDWINNLKLRLSYGKNGNMAIGAYSTLPRLSSANYLDANKESAYGYYPEQLGDPTLGWETSLTKNVGVDFGFLNNRIRGSLDIFTTNTTDLLLNTNISPVNGTTSITQNVGETENKGFDLQISSVNISKPNFNWTTDFNFSFYRNKIVNVGLTDEEGDYIDDVANSWFIGEPLGTIYRYVYDGVWQLDDDIANSAQPEAKPGDVKVRDVNGDGKIDPDDRDFVGNSQPSFTAGLNNTISYKNFTLNFFIHTIQGVTKYGPLWTTFFNEYNWNQYNYDFWTETNPTNEYPANRLATNPYGANRYEDASFIRLKDITLAYKFGGNITSKLQLNRLEIFFNIKNLITITDYKYGMDPEFSSNWAIPLNKTYLLGLRVSL